MRPARAAGASRDVAFNISFFLKNVLWSSGGAKNMKPNFKPKMSIPILVPTPGSLPSPVIELEEGWQQIYSQGILKLQRILDFGMLTPFCNDEYVRLYSIIYQMCTQKAPKCWTHQLYDRYCQPLSSETTWGHMIASSLAILFCLWAGTMTRSAGT